MNEHRDQMRQTIETQLSTIRNKIRFGKDPNNPMLIPLWLMQESDLCPSPTQSISAHRQHYEAQFRLLLETIVDELVPSHWRRLCLDHIYQPLGSLKRIANDEQSEQQVRNLMQELTVSSRYVASSLS